MKIGVDFDNTIVSYQESIKELADKFLDLPADISKTKQDVKGFLQAKGRNDLWTSFQGHLYGPGMRYAKPYEGCLEALSSLIKDGHEVRIISHRSRFPYAGEKYDLHGYASEWIERELACAGLLDTIKRENISFHESKEQKIGMIIKTGVEIFIDDLLSILNDEQLGNGIRKFHFCPEGNASSGDLITVSRWSEVPLLVKTDARK